MPRRCKDKPNKDRRKKRIDRFYADDPFNGDTEALKAALIARIVHHRETLGIFECIRRVRARGLPVPANELPRILAEANGEVPDDLRDLFAGVEPLKEPQ